MQRLLRPPLDGGRPLRMPFLQAITKETRRISLGNEEEFLEPGIRIQMRGNVFGASSCSNWKINSNTLVR